MTTHYEKIQALGNRMVTNLAAKGVSSQFSDGGLTLADKILDINQFNDGVFLTANKNIGQPSDVINFSAMVIKDGMFQVGKPVSIEDKVNTTPIYTKTRTGESQMTGFDIGSYSWKLVFGTYTGDENAPYVWVGDANATDKTITKTSTGFAITDDSTLNVNLTGSELYFYNTVFWTDTGAYYDMLNYDPNFTPTGRYMNTIIWVEGTVSFYKIYGGGVTGNDGVVTGTYTCTGAGKKEIVAKVDTS